MARGTREGDTPVAQYKQCQPIGKGHPQTQTTVSEGNNHLTGKHLEQKFTSTGQV